MKGWKRLKTEPTVIRNTEMGREIMKRQKEGGRLGGKGETRFHVVTVFPLSAQIQKTEAADVWKNEEGEGDSARISSEPLLLFLLHLNCTDRFRLVSPHQPHASSDTS